MSLWSLVLFCLQTAFFKFYRCHLLTLGSLVPMGWVVLSNHQGKPSCLVRGLRRSGHSRSWQLFPHCLAWHMCIRHHLCGSWYWSPWESVPQVICPLNSRMVKNIILDGCSPLTADLSPGPVTPHQCVSSLSSTFYCSTLRPCRQCLCCKQGRIWYQCLALKPSASLGTVLVEIHIP